jgi:hypothetical protein
MTSSTSSRDTARILRDNAEKLEDAEAVLHRSANASPQADTTRRLHQLGDAVTAEARTIQHRAERLDADSSDADPTTATASRA